MSVIKASVFRQLKVSDVVLNPAPGVDDFYRPVVPVELMKEVAYRKSKAGRVALLIMLGLLPVFVVVPFLMGGVYNGWSDSTIFLGMVGGVVWGMLAPPGLRVFSKKIDAINESFFQKNLDGFVSWLKERYGIIYQPETDLRVNWLWLYTIVCFGSLVPYKGTEVQDTFRDVNGDVFRLKRNGDGSLYVEENSVSSKELKHMSVLDESEFLQVSEMFSGEVRLLWDSVGRKLAVLSDLKLDASSDHGVSRVRQDLVELIKIVQELQKIDSLDPEDGLVQGVLSGLDNDLQRIIDGRAGELKRQLAGQFEWVKSRQVEEASTLGPLSHVAMEKLKVSLGSV